MPIERLEVVADLLLWLQSFGYHMKTHNLGDYVYGELGYPCLLNAVMSWPR